MAKSYKLKDDKLEVSEIKTVKYYLAVEDIDREISHWNKEIVISTEQRDKWQALKDKYDDLTKK